jgi:hypothetical protein
MTRLCFEFQLGLDQDSIKIIRQLSTLSQLGHFRSCVLWRFSSLSRRVHPLHLLLPRDLGLINQICSKQCMSWINCACALVPKSTPHQAQFLTRCYAHAINGPMSDLPQGLVMAISQSSIPEFSASTNSSFLDCGHSFQQLADPSLISWQGWRKFRLNHPTIFTSSASVELDQNDWCSEQQQW